MIDHQLLAVAAMYGCRVRSTADADTGEHIIRVFTPTAGADDFTDDAAAAGYLREIIAEAERAERSALEAAQQWGRLRADQKATREAWNRIAAAVNHQLPDGCEVPPVHEASTYRPGTNGPMTVVAATALAQWRADARDGTARRVLDDALTAEGSIMRATHAESYADDYWRMPVELWRPLALQPPETGDDIRDGRTLAATGERRQIAWAFYGVAVPLGRDAVDTAAEELATARQIISTVAERHRTDADRLAGLLGTND